MRTVVQKIAQGFGVTFALWIGYNIAIFAIVASGSPFKYIPYLHFPIKIFVAAVN